MGNVVTPGEVLYKSGGPEPQLTIHEPGFGATFAVGEPLIIYYTSTVALSVAYEISRDDGASWQLVRNVSLPIATAAEFDGGLASLPASATCLVRFRSATLTAVSDRFEIVDPGQPLYPPVIDQVSPTFALPGATGVRIYGSQFGATGGQIKLRKSGETLSTGCPVESWTDTLIVFSVPTSLTVGSYTLEVQKQDVFLLTDTVAFAIAEEEPPPPPPPPGYTRAKLVSLVNERLGNMVRWGSITRAGDGATRHYMVPDQFVRKLPVLDPDAVRLTVYDASGTVTGTESEGAVYDEEGNEVSAAVLGEWGSFDYVNNWYHFTDDLPAGYSFKLDYSYQWCPESFISHLIDSALSYLTGPFYVTHVRDYTISGNEYVVDHGGTPADGIVEVQYGSDGDWTRLTPFRDYRVMRGEQQECLLQVFGGITGTLRVRAAFPLPKLVRADDTLESFGIPEAIVECIVLYCCWQCLLQYLPPRMRYDQAVVTQGAGTPTVRDNQSTPQIYKMLLDIEVDKRQMRPWTARGL